ncbi:adenosine deaminase [Acrasis kona]|uniref:Adenosine deaminase n=1 Tax=Acrasis kona TaxID=1008807 RepID=A0AAW2YQ46_9EUKA
MMNILFLLFLSIYHVVADNRCAYDLAREKLLQDDASLRFSSSIKLTKEEEVVNNYLHTLKQNEVDTRYSSKQKYQFLSAHNYYEVRDQIPQSKVFQVLRKMPKGGHLHLHAGAAFDYRAIINYIRSDDYLWNHLYILYCDGVAVSTSYFPSDTDANSHAYCTGKPKTSNCKWKHGNTHTTDEIYRLVTIGPEDLPYQGYEAAQMWDIFHYKFGLGAGLTCFEPVFKMRIRNTIENMISDGVSFAEFRDFPGYIYNFDYTHSNNDSCGRNRIGGVNELLHLKSITDEYKKIHPTFVGISYIMAAGRSSIVGSYLKSIDLFKQLRGHPELKNIVNGFDLVGQEDAGKSLNQLYPSLQGQQVDYYFHSGETEQPGDIEAPNLLSHGYDEATEYNLFDAYLFSSKRLGHAVSLIRHPALMEKIRAKGMCVETCPISNQILAYIPDLRSHPAVTYMAAGLKVVISSDDPGLMTYNNMTFDTYASYMSWGTNLADLKMFMMNSIECASMSQDMKDNAKRVSLTAWDGFIKNTLVEACNADVDTLKKQSLHCSSIKGLFTSRSCFKLNQTSFVDVSVPVEVPIKFCSSITCQYQSLDNIQNIKTVGKVLSPCQIQCPVPISWTSANVSKLNLFVDDKPLCAGDGCPSITFVQ